MDSKDILKQIDIYLKDKIKNSLGFSDFLFPIDPNSIEDESLKDMIESFKILFDMINETYRYAEKISQGDLQAKAARGNFLSMPLKALQSSMANLTWQAGQVAKGDLSQNVYFLGEFSTSFNEMIASLKDKQIIEKQLKIITDVVGEGLILLDCDGEIVFANPEAINLLGYTFETIKGTLISERIYKQYPDGRLFLEGENRLTESIELGSDYAEDDAVFTCKSGQMVPVMFTSRAVFENGKLNGTVIAFRDITEQKKYLKSLETINKLLEKQATTDPLTGINNRIMFNKNLASEIQRAEREGTMFSVIIFDIDHFKQVNDTYGHNAGDNVLKKLTNILSANMRGNDLFARWGGEEFVILSTVQNKENVTDFADKLRNMVDHFDFNKPKHVSISLGATLYKAGDSPTSIVKRADEALYKAKESGRNKVVFHK